MSLEFEEIGFDAVEDWSVEDFYSFFHQINILYNRLNVLHDIKISEKQIKLKNAFNSSLSKVPLENRLKVKSIEIHSPGDFNLLGVDKIIAQLRGLLKDVMFKNKAESDALKEKNRHTKEMNNLKELMTKQKLIHIQINTLQKLGYDQEQIDIATKALLDPLSQIEALSNKKKISIKSPNKRINKDMNFPR